MKVNRPGRVSAPGSQSTKKKSASTGAKFTVSKPAHGQTAAPASGLGPIAAVDALLAAQEVGSETPGQRSKGFRTGEEMLEILQEVQAGLLLGRISVPHLQRLKTIVSERGALKTDSKLEKILEDIEVRAAVELAKLGYDI